MNKIDPQKKKTITNSQIIELQQNNIETKKKEKKLT